MYEFLADDFTTTYRYGLEEENESHLRNSTTYRFIRSTYVGVIDRSSRSNR
jgi:hypothetical protein